MNLSIGQLGPDAWTDRSSRSYRIHMPLDASDVLVSCEDVWCDSWRAGWETACSESDPRQARVAMQIRAGIVRPGLPRLEFAERREARDGSAVTVFFFHPGQECFAYPHRIRARPGTLLVHQRGQVVRQHTSLRFLAEDYTEHMGGIADQQQKG